MCKYDVEVLVIINKHLAVMKYSVWFGLNTDQDNIYFLKSLEDFEHLAKRSGCMASILKKTGKKLNRTTVN